MIGKKENGREPASISEVYEILEERKKHGELGYEQQLEYDYAKKFAKLSVEETKKMSKQLEAFGLRKETVYKIIEILPVDLMQLKLLLVPEKRTFADDELAKIMGIVEEYRSKK